MRHFDGDVDDHPSTGPRWSEIMARATWCGSDVCTFLRVGRGDFVATGVKAVSWHAAQWKMEEKIENNYDTPSMKLNQRSRFEQICLADLDAML